MKARDQARLGKLYRKTIDSRNEYHLNCENIKNFIVDSFELPNEDDDIFDEFFDLDEDNIGQNCGVFHQASDGMVFELCAKNAPLKQVVEHILKKGSITLTDYYNYTI